MRFNPLIEERDTICVCVDDLTSQTYWRPCWKTDVIKMVTCNNRKQASEAVK